MSEKREWSHYEPQLPEVLEDPYPAYAWLRDHAPVHYMPRLEAYVLSRYDDVLAAVRNHAVYSSVGGVGFRPPKAVRERPGLQQNESGGSGENGLSRTDNPQHHRIRRLVGSYFETKSIEGFRRRAEMLCDRLLDGVIGRRVNFTEEVAASYLPQIMGSWMGISDADLDFVGKGAAASSAVQSGNYNPGELEKIAAYRAYFQDMAKQRADDLARGLFTRDKPRDLSDVLFGVTHDGITLNEKEIAANLTILANGGNGNTSHFLSWMIWLFSQRPDLLEAIRAEPASIPAAAEELLRYLATTQGLCRVTKTPITVHDTTIPADTSVLLLYASGNRDERHYEKPGEIMLDRFPQGIRSADHLTFSHGIHVCLGNHMARLLIHIMLDRLIKRVRAVELVGPVRKGANYLVRAIEDVPVFLQPL